MTYTLIRECFMVDRTIGTLYLNGEPVCSTMEPFYRGQDLESSKIKGETAIPCGVYKISLSYSPRFKMILPEVHNVPFFEGIRMHAGNSPSDTAGCILLGELKGTSLINSKVNLAKVLSAMAIAKDREERMFLNIIINK